MKARQQSRTDTLPGSHSCHGLDDYDDATEIRPMHIAFLVDDSTFDAAHRRLLDGHVPTSADPGRSQPGQINHRYGGRGVYFDDPDKHLFELMTAPYRP